MAVRDAKGRELAPGDVVVVIQHPNEGMIGVSRTVANIHDTGEVYSSPHSGPQKASEPGVVFDRAAVFDRFFPDTGRGELHIVYGAPSRCVLRITGVDPDADAYYTNAGRKEWSSA